MDVVSCQFLIQRAFGTEQKAKIFAGNVSRAVKPGGFFILSLTNAEKIKGLFPEGKETLVASNSVFSIELEEALPKDCPEFGIRMTFGVDDRYFPENLVHMETLERILGEEGLKLVWRKSFLDLYEEAHKRAVERELLTFMGVTENGRLLMTDPEMETAALYEGAMFKKI